jgi:hypothetical protein
MRAHRFTGLTKNHQSAKMSDGIKNIHFTIKLLRV